MPRRAVLIALLALFSVGLFSAYPAFSQTAKETAVLGEMRLLHEQTRSAAEKATSEAQWAKTFNTTALTVTGIVLGIVAIFGIAFTIVFTRRIRDLTDEAKEFRDLAEKSMEKTESYMERAAKVTDELEKRREDIERSINAQVAQAIETIKAEVGKAVKEEVASAIEDLDRREKEAVAAIDKEKDRATEFHNFFMEGMEEYRNGNYEASLKAYNKALEIDDQHAIAWSNKGLALWRLGKQKEALKVFQKSLELNPSNSTTLTIIGGALCRLGRFHEALEVLEEAHKLNPDYAMAWSWKGYVLGKLELEEDAISAHEKAISLAPLDGRVLTQKAITLTDLNRHGEALVLLEEILKDDLEKEVESAAWSTKGLVLLEIGDQEEGLKDLKKAVEIDPNRAGSWYNLACGHSKLDQKDEMMNAIKRAVLLGPDEFKEKAKTDLAFEPLPRRP
ncbi:MAG: tetratricopeptide repeat protein [bacterium]|nr:tetratricopeptide repeat protein [bacterium]